MGFLQKRVAENEFGFGQELKALRELRGLTRSDLSRLTGIHALVIAIFEEERLNELADPVYDERHVVCLVHALEGKEAFFRAKYRAILSASGRTSSQDVLLHPCVRKRDFFVFSRTPIVVGVLIILASIGGFVGWHVLQVSAPPILHVTSPEEGAHITGSAVVLSGQTEGSATVTVNGARVLVDPSGHFEARFDMPIGLNTLRIEAKRRQGQATFLERHVISDRVERTAVMGPVTSTQP